MLNLDALAELLKQAKRALAKDDVDGAMDYVGLLVKRAGAMVGQGAPQPTGVTGQLPVKPAKQNGPAERMSVNEIADLDRLNKANTFDERAACHEKILGRVKEAFERGAWSADGKLGVSVPVNWGSVSELEPFLRSRGIHFSQLDKGLFPMLPGVTPRDWQLTFTR